LQGLRAAPVDEIAKVEGINRALAQRLWDSLHGLAQAGAGSESGK